MKLVCSDPSSTPLYYSPHIIFFPFSNLPGLIDAIILRGGRRAVDENTVPPLQGGGRKKLVF
jgi:hypothetical protein